jgi:hypothetical protein
MSTSSATPHQSSASVAEHDATRGVLNAVVVGAALWCAMIAAFNWAFV